MNVDIGELNKRIVIISQCESEDEDGFPIQSEKIIHNAWAKVSNTSGTEVIKSGAEFSDMTTRFLIRYTKKEINEKMAIRFNKQLYDIKYINDYNYSHDFFEIIAKVRKV